MSIEKKEIVRIMFEKSFRNLLITMPLNKISVSDIANGCNMSRQTFYNNFIDKYDLIAWIFSKQAEEFVSKFPRITWFEVISSLLDKMQYDSDFYPKVMNKDGQNSLIEYMVTYDINIYEKMLQDIAGIHEINDSLRFDIKFHAYACVHMTQLWITSQICSTPTDMAKSLLKAMPKQLFENIPNRGIDFQ